MTGEQPVEEIFESPPLSGPAPFRVRPHVPLRPIWLCRACAEPWPCVSARLALKCEFHGDRLGLCVYLGLAMQDALADLLALGAEHEPTDLYQRFLSWARRVPLGYSEAHRQPGR